ncbi:Na(+)/H(+) antiporter subunit B [Tepidamorphus sp. 3E244]|uniref:Na(+)/H(+) antiporter subunit B n=1 Tax=Tepidamorphus sp. 3E244 TaxID=3385498 RepID=UPI0038FCE9DB
MKLDVVLRVVTKLMLPFMLIFAFYVQFHGDYGPGGGFQAGVIAAAAVILYAIMFGLEAGMRIVPPWLVEKMIPLGVIIFAGTGVVCMLLGENFLNYTALDHHSQKHAQEWGVFIVEVGVFVTVSSTMVAIFYAFGGRGR